VDGNSYLEVEYAEIWQFLVKGCCFAIITQKQGLVNAIQDHKADQSYWIQNGHAARECQNRP
jgi:hypothetical protein